MRRFVFGVAAAVLASTTLWATRAEAQTQSPLFNFNLYGGGTRPMSMAGAFLGLSDDASAATWNPAGLTQNDRIFAELDWGFGGQKVTNTLDSPEDLSLLYGNVSSQSISHFYYLAINGPLTLKGQRFHLAASWNRASFDNYQAEYTLTDFSDFPPDPTGATVPLGLHTYQELIGGPEFATLAMATQLKEEMLSLGFGLNIFSGSSYDSSAFLIDLDETNPFSNQTVPLRVVEDDRDQLDYSGLNFNVGALFQAGQFTVGARVLTPFKLEQKHDTRNAQAVYQRTTDSLLLITETSVLNEHITQTEMPLQLGLGITFRPQENLILAVDYEYKAFSKSKLYVQEDLFDPKSELVAIDPEFKDVHQIRFGMEYQIGVGWGVIPVRAGFRTEPQPYQHRTNAQESLLDFPSQTISSEGGNQVVGQVYTLGAGVEWQKIRVDLSWEYGSSTRYTDGFVPNSFLKPEFIQSRETNTQRIILGFTGFF
jgi:long-subunit fatty acid transport protein